jgi:geranylgeranyl pyrophosphate synthase
VKPAATDIAAVMDAGGPHLGVLMARVEDRLRTIAEPAGLPLSEWAGGTIAAGGKRLRPLLSLLAAGGPTTGEEQDALVRAGVAVELLHVATLVHDDVLDAATLRRGAPTVWAVAGRSAATTTGDFLFATAFAELARNDDPDQVKALSAASSGLARGELLQRADAWDASITVERYLERCELKTARLFAAACELGELAAGRSPALASFGLRIGLAFQVLDDVLDVSGPTEATGKHRGTDLLDGTITLPLVLARRADAELAALDPRSVVDSEAAERVCDMIARTGALEEARDYALALVADAKAELPARLEPSTRAALELIADGVANRGA